jgi:hypothetical protein
MSLRQKYNDAKAQIVALQAELARVTAESAAKDATIVDLQVRISVLEFDIATLQQQLADCEDPEEPPAPTFVLHGAYGRDAAGGTTGMQAAGLNTVTNDPNVAELDALEAKGMKAILWLGSFDRKEQEGTCTFERSDQWVTDHVQAVAGHPAIALYQITDEPNGALFHCPDVPDQVKARGEMIKSIDPSAVTYVTLATDTAWDVFADSADVFGIPTDPVSIKNGYNEEKIPNIIARAQAAGFDRVIAIMQLFATPTFYRLPTPEELQHQYDQWGTFPEGRMLYHWRNVTPELAAVVKANS